MNTNRTIKNLIYFLSLSMLLVSCSAEMDLKKPQLKVTASALTIKEGETVKFYIEGNPNIITFYSGEIGNDYSFSDKERILPVKEVNLSFQSQVRTQGGSAGYCQDDQFHIMISDNLSFDGNTRDDSIKNISEATWKDITDKFTLCPLECKSTTPYTSSGQYNILDSISLNTPVYFAFRYVNKPNAENGNATIWRFQAFNLTETTDVGETPLLAQTTANWIPLYSFEDWGTNAFTNSGSQVTLRGLTSNTGYNELWCISQPVQVQDVNLGKEFGVAIKSLSDIPLTNYEYQFNEAGTYTVTFLGINANISGEKETECQLQITVTP